MEFKPLFGKGVDNVNYAQYFVGNSYVNGMAQDIVNVTFEPGCRNNWHIHNHSVQVLLVTDGEGFYQEWGQEKRLLKAGDVVVIPEGAKHWHGASSSSWFSHVSVSMNQEGAMTEWLEKVNDEDYKG